MASSAYRSKEQYHANESRGLFIDRPNVSVAFAGTKISNGIDTGRECVVIGVEEKVPEDQLGEAVLPKELPDGVITDVQVVPRFQASGTCTGGTGLGCPPHDSKYRPLQGGISGIRQGSTACTIAMIVQDARDLSVVALTNNHCAGLLFDPNYSIPTDGTDDATGIVMLQPSPYDGGTAADAYGTVKRAVALKFGSALAQNLVDGSISTVAVNEGDYPILELDDGPFPFADKTMYAPGLQLSKSGRTTGITPPPTTTLLDENAAVNVYYGTGTNNRATFVNQLLYYAATRFSQGGDSGSAMVAFISGRWRIVGLHFAGDTNGLYGVANPIEYVSSLLDVQAWNGEVVVPLDTRANITVFGRQYQRVGDVHRVVTHNAD